MMSRQNVLVIGSLVFVLSALASAQAPASGDAAVQQPRVYADMLQLMRAVVYPASNVIFTAQSDDPATVKPSPRPSTSPDPLTSVYGGWQAVEHAGLALAESANLLILPRVCGNGKPAPVQNADWQMWVQGLRDAGMVAYKTAQTKNQDAILEAALTVSESCQNCHRKYRTGGLANRC